MRTLGALVAGFVSYFAALILLGFVHGFVTEGSRLGIWLAVFNALSVVAAMLVAIWVARPRYP